MKTIPYLLYLCILLFSACKKHDIIFPENIPAINPNQPGFTNYTIRQGQQYCDQNTFAMVEYAELKFVVKFDSSAIYSTVNPSNQYDINKLYGFSDNDSLHQRFSARFGWRWSDNALRLFAYVYNSGIRTSKELGAVQIGAENNCSIKVANKYYVFSLNNITDTLMRSSTTARGSGYKLYPYFGGDEAAPHNINILIKELRSN